MFTDSQFDFVSILYTVVSFNVLWRLKNNWAAFWDDVVTPADRQLADAVAVFLLVPIGVFFHELGHAIATWQMGGTVLEFQWRIFWGYVVPGGSFTVSQLWWLAFSGNLVSILLGVIAIPLAKWVKPLILKETLQTFARFELIYALVLYPFISFAGQQGDWLMIYDFRAQPYAHITLALHIFALVLLWQFNQWLTQPSLPSESFPAAELLQESPARFYRKHVRFGLAIANSTLPPPSPAEEKLEVYLDALHNQWSQRYSKKQASSTPGEGDSFGIFIIAVGRLAFGRLEAVPNIINNMPQTGNVRQLALVIPILLPLPNTLDLFADTQSVMEWIETHRSQLIWDEASERFVLQPLESSLTPDCDEIE